MLPIHAGDTSRLRCSSDRPSVHPRSRGEHAKKSKSRNLGKGSSPLARGTPQGNFTLAVKERLIPACAGNTAPHSQSAKPRSAHPRSRREHSSKVCCVSAQPGSSPLARGTRGTVRGAALGHRLIPARAGNTSPAPHPAFRLQAHPRSRGEHLKALIGGLKWCGLSPLARGTLSKRVQRRDRLGLIPACAGNMSLWFLLRCVPAAHPRSRGEHVVQQRRADNAVGSSLLARGTQLSLHQHCIHVGLIPARAGNTLWRNCWAPARAAHPRSRREHTKDPVVGVQAPGSSPIARGAREIQIHMQRLVRLIPARAGSTKSTNSGVHPNTGSSPLARGTLRWFLWLYPGLRFIPTRAGNR